MYRDLQTMALTAGYFAVLLVLVETLRRRVHVASDVTRKIFLMGTGAWALVAVRVFEDKGSAVLVYAALAVLLYLSFRFELFAGIEDSGPSLGTVFLALAAASLLALFWGGRIEIGVAAVVAAVFGDAAAALVGRRFGTRKFRSFAHMRSMEGTLAMFLVSGLVMAPILAGSGGLGWHQAVAFSLITATVAASVEAGSAYGVDNLTVPLAAAATLVLLFRFTQ